MKSDYFFKILQSENLTLIYSPKIETRDKNSSYIFRLRIVDPIRILRYESLSMPHNLTWVLARTVAALGVP